MRRLVTTLGIVAILVSSCGRSDPPNGSVATMQERVASVRELAEAGKPGLALDRLENLVASITTQIDQGSIDQGWALEILESADAVGVQLRLLRASSSRSEAPTPSPVEEGGGEEGSGDGDKGSGKDKGHGDEGHGNDD